MFKNKCLNLDSLNKQQWSFGNNMSQLLTKKQPRLTFYCSKVKSVWPLDIIEIFTEHSSWVGVKEEGPDGDSEGFYSTAPHLWSTTSTSADSRCSRFLWENAPPDVRLLPGLKELPAHTGKAELRVCQFVYSSIREFDLVPAEESQLCAIQKWAGVQFLEV